LDKILGEDKVEKCAKNIAFKRQYVASKRHFKVQLYVRNN